jgi:hypothetical protein
MHNPALSSTHNNNNIATNNNNSNTNLREHQSWSEHIFMLTLFTTSY